MGRKTGEKIKKSMYLCTAGMSDFLCSCHTAFPVWFLPDTDRLGWSQQSKKYYRRAELYFRI